MIGRRVPLRAVDRLRLVERRPSSKSKPAREAHGRGNLPEEQDLGVAFRILDDRAVEKRPRQAQIPPKNNEPDLNDTKLCGSVSTIPGSWTTSPTTSGGANAALNR